MVRGQLFPEKLSEFIAQRRDGIGMGQPPHARTRWAPSSGVMPLTAIPRLPSYSHPPEHTLRDGVRDAQREVLAPAAAPAMPEPDHARLIEE